MDERKEIIEAAIRGIEEYMRDVRGARVVKSVTKNDNHCFAVELCDGTTLHFDTMHI